MSSNDKHHATFSWAAGAQSVYIAGNFNNWSAEATPLKKQPDGSFTAQVPLPWGEKQAFKYVVDGEWKVREDEAKEWDAAGNMNNVYTAPPAPISTSPTSTAHSHSNIAASAPTPIAASSEKTARPTEQDKPSSSHPHSPVSATTDNGPVRAAVPAKNVNINDTPSPTQTQSKTQPENLIASSAPGAASGVSSNTTHSSTHVPSHGLGGAPLLGGVVFPTTSKPKSSTTETIISPPTTATTTTSEVRGDTSPTVPVESTFTPVEPTPVPTQPEVHAKSNVTPLADEPISVQIEKVAKRANIGEAPQPGTEEQGIAEKASDFAAGALAAIGAVVGNAAVAVENLTGLDIAHTAPVSVEEAKAQGIDVRTLNRVDAPTDTTAPVGTAPPASAVDALQEKVDELKLGSSGSANIGGSRDTTGISDVPLPNTAEPKRFEAPPGSVTLNQPEPEKENDHDIPAQHETINNHQTVPQPKITTVSEKDPKKDRTSPATTLEDTAGTKPISSNPGISAKEQKKIAERDPIKTASSSDSPLSEPKISPNAPTSNINKQSNENQNIDKITPTPQPKSNTVPVSSSSNKPVNAAIAPPPVHASDAPSTPSKIAPATPAKDTTSTVPIPATASATSTPASTPAKSTHTKEKTTDSDIRKRKSSIFGKIKHAFSPKDKSK